MLQIAEDVAKVLTKRLVKGRMSLPFAQEASNDLGVERARSEAHTHLKRLRPLAIRDGGVGAHLTHRQPMLRAGTRLRLEINMRRRT
jgi:hypothetical protein